MCAEMFLGLPLFPGVSQHNQLGRIVEMLGMPPDIFIETKQGLKYFTRKDINAVDKDGNNDTAKEGSKHNPHPPQESSKFRLKTAEEYAAETNTEVPTIKKYLRYNQLDEIIMKCPLANKSKLTTGMSPPFFALAILNGSSSYHSEQNLSSFCASYIIQLITLTMPCPHLCSSLRHSRILF